MPSKLRMICLEGIDKSGKSMILKYLQQLGSHEHLILDRGPLSNYVFSKMFNRGFKYDIGSFVDTLFVFLDVCKEDWEIRCKVSNEPNISYESHYAMYEEAIEEFKSEGCRFIRYNTSEMSMYSIAKDILAYWNANCVE